jgi:hypothetical protein
VKVPAQEFAASQTLVERACSICKVVGEFQSTLAYKIQMASDVRLCSSDTWFRARCAPAQSLVTFYLRMPDGPSLAKVKSSECDFCRRTLQEQSARLRELMKQIDRTMFLQRMKNQASVGLDHRRKLEQHAPWKIRPVVNQNDRAQSFPAATRAASILRAAVRTCRTAAEIPRRTPEFLAPVNRDSECKEGQCSRLDPPKRS